MAIRRWYRTARWAALRARVLLEEPWCPDCQAESGIVVQARDVHHVRKHQGDSALFWSRANLQALCHAHHAVRTGRGE